MLLGISGKIGSGKDTLAGLIALAKWAKQFNVEEVFTEKDLGDPAMIDRAWRQVSPRIEVRKFADSLKEIVALLTGCNRRDLERQEFKEQELPPMWNRTAQEAREWLIMRHFSVVADTTNQIAQLDDSEVVRQAGDQGFKFIRTYREMLQEIGTEAMRTHFHPNVWVNALFSNYIKRSPLDHWVNDPRFKKAEVYPNWIVTDVRFVNEADAVKDHQGVLIQVQRKSEQSAHVVSHASETGLDKYSGFDEIIDNNGSLTKLYAKAQGLIEKYKL